MLTVGQAPIGGKPAAQARAAQYVRMSTEHEKYSTQNQADPIQPHAARRGLTVVRTYADEGKSGLSLDARDALSLAAPAPRCGRVSNGRPKCSATIWKQVANNPHHVDFSGIRRS